MIQKFFARGKLLLTAEYFVLDGAPALALPTILGQSLELNFSPRADSFEKILHWQSLDEKGQVWFRAGFERENFEILQTDEMETARRLQQILREARNLNSLFLSNANLPLPAVSTRLGFPRNWGLGTSSTLIYLIASWAEINPFELQFRTFGGSGYDIACAGASGPILYFLKNKKPEFQLCDFRPSFSNSLYFIYLNKKQNSREGIKRYRKAMGDKEPALDKISRLTWSFLEASTLAGFEKLLAEHEKIVSDFIEMPGVRELYFDDFPGAIKSSGAWGGDFVLAASSRPFEFLREYFETKGFPTIIPYSQLII